MTDSIEEASAQINRCCRQRRYRVAWITGPPYSGKTSLARQLCTANAWSYLDYTLAPGYFDSLASTIAHYQPINFIDALRTWCSLTTAPVLVVDEVDSLLASWSFDQRHTWASQVSRLPFLACGLVLVTHFFDRDMLVPYLPDNDPRHCLDLAGANL